MSSPLFVDIFHRPSFSSQITSVTSVWKIAFSASLNFSEILPMYSKVSGALVYLCLGTNLVSSSKGK